MRIEHRAILWSALAMVSALGPAAAAVDPEPSPMPHVAPGPGPGGTVSFKGRFAADGSVAELRLVFSEPKGKFDAVATRAMNTWKVKPWWARSASRGAEFLKTLNFLDDQALRSGEVDIDSVFPGEFEPDESWGRELRVRVMHSPRWPEAATAPLRGGWVRVTGTITVEGRADDLRVVDSHPPGLFDESALRSVRTWRFARYDEAPILEPRPFSQTMGYDAGFTTFEMMQAAFLTTKRVEAQRLLEDLAALCPDRYPRAADDLNDALRAAPRKKPLPSGATPMLPDDVAEGVALMERYGGCLFSSWEHLSDARAFHAGSRFGWFDQSIWWRARFALCERAVALGAAPGSCIVQGEVGNGERDVARRWVAARFGVGFQQLIAQRAAERGESSTVGPEAREALAAARAAHADDKHIKPIAILTRALKRASGDEDRAVLNLALARVMIDAHAHGDAQERLDAVVAAEGSPWYAVQMARVLSFGVAPNWRGPRNSLDENFAALTRDLGIGGLLALPPLEPDPEDD